MKLYCRGTKKIWKERSFPNLSAGRPGRIAQSPFLPPGAYFLPPAEPGNVPVGNHMQFWALALKYASAAFLMNFTMVFIELRVRFTFYKI